ncbi:hypothetical protein Gasu2_21250 [Galdieria sulphuraria]|nr:hypothetical protein Gasu2_21250 [Galdieria sulphuraria]
MSYFRTLVRKRGVYLSLAALVTARLLLVSSYGDWLDLCVVDRAVEKLPPVNSFVIPIRDSLLHNFTGAAIFLVSFFWTFHSLTSLFQVKQLYWRDSRRGKQLKATLLWILENYISKLFLYTFIIGSIVTVYRTFFHGYHSLRQILYGLGLGCLSHALMETVLWEYFIAGRHVLLILGILALLSPNLLFFCTLFWPFPVYGYPVGSKQVMGHIINWLILFISRNAWTNALHPMKRGRHKDRSSLREQHIQDILKANDEKK